MNETTKRMYLYAVMAATLVPALFVVNTPRDSSVSAWTFWGSAVAGYIGVVFMLWMYAIGTRAVSSLFFVDQAKLLKAHSWLGKYGTILMFLHPILITISYGEGVLYSFLPQFSTEFATHVTLGRIAFIALLAVWITSALVRSKMSYRVWKYLHFLSYAAVPFALLHIPDTGSSYAAELAARVYFYTIVIGFLAFSLLKLRDLLAYNKYRYRVTRNVQVSPGVFLIDITPIAEYFTVTPGQYVYLKNDFLSEEHPFSVTLYNRETNVITITFKVFGRFTERLADIAVGEELMAMGPFGEFTQQIDTSPERPVVYVAGGIGVTPFIERIMTENSQREQWLFYANKRPETATFSRELGKILGKRMVSVYSDVADIAKSPTTERGRLSSATFAKYLNEPHSYDYYICGPTGLMEAVRDELIELGVTTRQIYTEEFCF